MQLQTPEELQWASNVAHWIEGGMFGVVALTALFQALGYAQSRGAQYFWPGQILGAGIFLPVYILLQRGFDGIGVTWNLVLRDPQQREHFLMALLLLAIGSVETLIRKDVLRSEVWKFVAPVALVLIGILLFFHTEYGTPEAITEASTKHAFLGFVIILAGLLKAAEVLWQKRFRWLAFPWIVLLFVAALMLITYREPPGAYRTNAPNQRRTTRLQFAPWDTSFHFHTGGTSMRRTIALVLLSVTAFCSACTTADNTNSNTNTATTASSPMGTATPANANMGNMNAGEHANMNVGNKNGNMNMANHNMNANKKP